MVLYSGCRSAEAGWVVQGKSIADNDYHAKHQTRRWKATAPAEITKTGLDYTWILPDEATCFVAAIRELDGTGFADYEKLKDSLRSFFSHTVLPGARVPRQSPTGELYSLRSLRCMRATEYVRLLLEYLVMGWEPKPLNPTNHTSLKTTLANYAEAGCDDPIAVRVRCVHKFQSDADKRQDWMDGWTTRQPEQAARSTSA